MSRGLLCALALSCAFTASAAKAEEPPPSTEQAVFARWIAHGKELQALRTRIGEARFDVTTATLLPNPSLDIAGSRLLSGANVNGQLGIGPSLTVPLPVFGQLGARKNEAVANLRVAEVDVLNEIWQRSGELEDTMLDRAFAEAEYREVENNLAELARITRIVAARASAGANSSYDTLRVATTEATFRAALATAASERARAETELVAQLAVPGLSRAPVTRDGLSAFRGPENEAALLAGARARRPDLELARRGVRAAEASASRYRREAAPIPTVSVGPYFTREPWSVSLQATVSVPLPVFDRNQGEVGKALEQASGQRQMADAVEQRIQLEVHGAWLARERAREALGQFRDIGMKSSDELLARAEVSYQAGAFGILDLLDAYRAVWEARAQALELEHAFAKAEAQLEHAAVLVPIAQTKE